jgi:predicted dehydrogenase
MSLLLNRRSFLVAGGFTALASTKAFGANERLRVGVIGAGGRMKSVLDAADQSGVPFEIVSVCDVYAPRRAEIKARGNAAAATEHVDYQEVLDDKTIDAVFIATPDHWHVRIATAALAAGKDVYLESPSRTRSKRVPY